MATVASKKAQKAEDFAISQSLLDIDEPDALRPGMCSSHVFTNFQSTIFSRNISYALSFFQTVRDIEKTKP